MSLEAIVEGVGLIGPGLASWEDARSRLRGREPFHAKPTVLPMPEALPATERRRAGRTVRLALAAGLEAARIAGRNVAELAAVFASSGGESENCHAICEALASEDRLISPTRFHNSVHNAAAGYWSIATGAMSPADAIAAYDASFAAGLLEAMIRIASEPRAPVLLIAYDTPYPQPLHGVRPIADSFAVGLVLAPVDSARRGARIAVRAVQEPPAAMEDAALEALRTSIPAARALPLLALLACNQRGTATAEYLDGGSLAIEVTP